MLGLTDGANVGIDGDSLGDSDGDTLGLVEGEMEGLALGAGVGLVLGDTDGEIDGLGVGDRLLSSNSLTSASPSVSMKEEKRWPQLGTHTPVTFTSASGTRSPSTATAIACAMADVRLRSVTLVSAASEAREMFVITNEPNTGISKRSNWPGASPQFVGLRDGDVLGLADGASVGADGESEGAALGAALG